MSEKEVKDSGQPAEFAYSDADAALADILDEARDRDYFRILNLSPEVQRAPVHWRAAAAAIVDGSDNLNLDAESFWKLDRALNAAPDKKAADDIRLIARVWADRHWHLIENKARAVALDLPSSALTTAIRRSTS